MSTRSPREMSAPPARILRLAAILRRISPVIGIIFFISIPFIPYNGISAINARPSADGLFRFYLGLQAMVWPLATVLTLAFGWFLAGYAARMLEWLAEPEMGDSK